ncbi:phosphotransferase enzyme family protein [Mycolicibacterium hassiacum DSM 44199]|jgi:aminoglycoside phosphotransferase (APT) family kinase protein|uniref:Phosphotransferase enzyme family protein n=1 Tax=Mycolicibacterium hassiacum (strain DSM 44199 / CIP 105218 / JCM 12690 / 3849) TaxID=1122247 RepID=K5BKP4_MYCHD|nr:phosphotransferase family protein [Mycolicibacterium hassiacum]EKF25219.1 phosphotransferase enzyme family protein [Mycolicibacterium hassiacum DSM 44199]MBX5489286.1 phosphotransferase family protein [Mycolicibacterium hassiacum]MDA4087192.1 aminoglycoside phosphotransferase [Mycolicibacterium hassiacum DSM 44199]PZN17549.1 MAG: phosphotransferase family protein [Mycolicibacterium hassiacum]VCT89172.1 Putative aminoglycoside phosphotransferase [Mycolicibacterium hassiacum DSM 44199]
MPDDVQQLPTLSDDDQAALTDWVRRQGLGETVGDVEPLTGGTQNIVVRLRIDDRTVVLRRPPLHPRPTSNKTMLREIAALRTLAGTPVPHPEFIAGCEDLSVLGVVFYLMEEVDGFNPGDRMEDAYVRNPDWRHRVGLSYAAGLARLGQVAWEHTPLAELKRPGSFLQRQVPQFLRLLDSYRHDRYDPATLAVGELADWLTANLPPDGPLGVIHGDPHLSNVLLRRDRPELAAFVDWEMCTIGDPLLDLGWMLICWPLETDTIGAGAQLAALGGLAGRAELLEAYLSAGGRETDHLDWYLALACFKLGIVIEGTWSRYLAGQAGREAGERLHTSAQHLIDIGTRITKGDNPFGLA